MKARIGIALSLIGTIVTVVSCTKTEYVGPIVDVVLEYTEGTVQIDGETAVAGQKLKPKFTVSTGDDSYCAVIFNRKNIMHVDANTFAEVDLGKAVKRVKLHRGVLASALRKLDRIAEDDEGFKLETPIAVAGVRGTVFFVNVESDSRSYICTCNGILRTADAEGGNDLLVASAHHTAYRYLDRGGSFAAESAPFLYHSDEMMELGAARIGEKIDWTTVGP